MATTTGLSLEDILGHMPLTKTLRTTSNGIPNPFPPEFFRVDPSNRVLGNVARYTKISGERRTAKRSDYGAPSRKRSLREVARQDVKMLHLFEHFDVDVITLQKLQSFDQYVQDEGMDFLKYQFETAGVRPQNSRIACVASMLRQGAIYFDSEGNILPTSSGADSNYTVSAGIPATHLNQANGIISSSWALANTDIPGHIRALQQASRQATGLPLDTALYGINIPQYIMQNDYSIPFLSRDGDARSYYNSTGQLPQGLFGIKRWIPVYTSFFVGDDDSTINELWDDDAITFLPAMGGSGVEDEVDTSKMAGWWRFYEGSMPVPKSYNIGRDAMATLGNFEIQYGQFSYGVPILDPVSARVHFGDVFLAVIANPLAAYMLDVTP